MSLVFDAQRHADAAFFEDWSWGTDDRGLWLWPVVAWRAIVIRSHDHRMIQLIRECGGRLQVWAGPYGRRRDWLVPAENWHLVATKKQQLIAARRASK